MPIDFDDEREPVNLMSRAEADIKYLNVSGDSMQNTLDMNFRKITNVANPIIDSDCPNKKYVDDKTSLCVLKENGELSSDLDCKEKRLKHVRWPQDEHDAVPRNFVSYSSLQYNQACDCYTAKNKRISEVADCTTETDAVNKKTLDTQLAKFVRVIPNGTLDLEGMSLINLNLRNLTVSYRKMSAPLYCNDNKIVNLSDCTDQSDATNKKYVDEEINKLDTRLITLTNTSMTGIQINQTIERKLLLALNNIPIPSTSTSAVSRIYVSSFVDGLLAETNIQKILPLKLTIRLPRNSNSSNKTYYAMISDIEIGQINNTDQITYFMQIPQFITSEYNIKIKDIIISVISGHKVNISFEIITNANHFHFQFIFFLFVLREPIQSVIADISEVRDRK